jgi:hypothetical protein
MHRGCMQPSRSVSAQLTEGAAKGKANKKTATRRTSQPTQASAVQSSTSHCHNSKRQEGTYTKRRLPQKTQVMPAIAAHVRIPDFGPLRVRVARPAATAVKQCAPTRSQQRSHTTYTGLEWAQSLMGRPVFPATKYTSRVQLASYTALSVTAGPTASQAPQLVVACSSLHCMHPWLRS